MEEPVLRESYPGMYSKHLCGTPYRTCNTCNRHFCPQCEGNLCTAYHFYNINECCQKAICEYFRWCVNPKEKKKEKILTKLEDVTDGKL